MGYGIPCCGSRIKKKPLKRGVWLYAGYRKGCCCFATQKKRDGGFSKEYQLQNWRRPYTMEVVQNKELGAGFFS
jgi:hypothetical protein